MVTSKTSPIQTTGLPPLKRLRACSSKSIPALTQPKDNTSSTKVWLLKDKSPRSTLLKSIYTQLDTGILCDVAFEVEGKELFTHRAVLAKFSPVFETMFTNGMKETHRNSKMSRVALHEVPHDTFQHLLQYIYTGSVSAPLEKILEVLKIADMYNVAKVVAGIEEFFLSQDAFMKSNTMQGQMWRLSNDYKLDALKAAVVDNLEKKLAEYAGQDMIDLPVDLLTSMLSSGKIIYTHKRIVILKFICDWIDADEDKRSCHTDALFKLLQLGENDGKSLDVEEVPAVADQLVERCSDSKVARDVLHYFLKRLSRSSAHDLPLIEKARAWANKQFKGAVSGGSVVALKCRIFNFCANDHNTSHRTKWTSISGTALKARLYVRHSGYESPQGIFTSVLIEVALSKGGAESQYSLFGRKLNFLCFLVTQKGCLTNFKRFSHYCTDSSTDSKERSGVRDFVLQDQLLDVSKGLYHKESDSIEIGAFIALQ